MIVASTLASLPLLAIALIARRLRHDLEETAWRLIAVTMLVTPFVALLPKFDIGVRVPVVSAHEPPLPTDSKWPVLAICYAVIATLLAVRLALSVLAAWNLRRGAARFADAHLSSAVRVPVTVGLLRPAILLPWDARTWSDEKRAAVLAHEGAHVARRDPLWRLIGRAAVAVSWYHPLAWLASAAIERIAEETADREAIRKTGDRHQYASVVLDLLRAMTATHRRVLVTAMLDGRRMSARIDAILQPPPRRRARAVSRVLLATCAAGTIFVTGMTQANVPEKPLTGAELARQEEVIRVRNGIRDHARQRLRETLQELFRPFAIH